MPENEHPEMRDRALGALALARASGVPWLATMARVQAVATGDASVVELRIGCPGPSDAGLVGVAMLADLALGAALRSQVGARRALPTLTLTLELDPDPPRRGPRCVRAASRRAAAWGGRTAPSCPARRWWDAAWPLSPSPARRRGSTRCPGRCQRL
ncbi:hypothetical protein ACFQY7_06120 [Actinomadura luteofluorescens]|uniref:hypothetical protein n=1 Tax=Actinomadura luteofluorescens TaxID=46163 RepID=UPI003636A4AE